MTKLSKKYALVSTSYYYDGEWKNFYILRNNLTEEDLVKIKFYHDEHMRLWRECYAKEKENAKYNRHHHHQPSLHRVCWFWIKLHL